MIEFVVKLAAVGVFVVGAITLAAPWLRGADRGVEHRHLPPPGLVCWDTLRATAAGERHSTGCEPAPGWHEWRSPRGEVVVVPDDAEPVWRRRYVTRF